MVQFKDLEDGVFDSIQSAISRTKNCCGEVHVGTDVLSISRMEKALEVTDFKQRFFTTDEIKYCESKRHPAQHYAARWAAKESVIKAYPLSENRITFDGIEVIVEKDSPHLKIEPENRIKESAVSLTHDESVDAALSYVVLITES